MPRSFLAFGLVTLFPLPLLLAGALFGGWAPWLALAYVTVVIAGVDALMPAMRYDGEAAEEDEATLLSQVLVAVHFVLLMVVIWSLSGGGPGLFSLSGLALFLASALFFGQVSAANAHELIHKTARPQQLMGRWVYISLLFGHHASAHLLVHHPRVATPDDPMTAELEESFYHFAPRAWLGSFIAARRIVHADLERAGYALWHPSNPFLSYIGGAFAMLVLMSLIGGVAGVALYLLMAVAAQAQILASAYVQHYGLQRRQLNGGSYAPVNTTHSWNAPHWLSSLWTLNSMRLSDHYAHPARPFPQLDIPERGQAPMLPYALPTMMGLALVPKLFFGVMNPHAIAWRNVT
ncbi:MAG: alkane 1-monooxygenase [Pseudomonadota bacterium]